MSDSPVETIGGEQRSIKVDELFITACRNTGVALYELEAKTLEDFYDGATPTSSAGKSKAAKDSIPKDVLERRHKNFEALRLRKLHMVLVEREKLLTKRGNTLPLTSGRQRNDLNEGSPQAPTPSGGIPSSASVAPPSSFQGQSGVIPRPPIGPLSARAPFARNSGSGSASTPTNSMSGGSPKIALEPLDFGDQKEKNRNVMDKKRTSSIGSYTTNGRSSNTPRLPPCEGASNASRGFEGANGGDDSMSNDGSTYSARARKSQRDLLIEQAIKKRRNRSLQVQRSVQAAMMKEVKEEDQKRKAAEVQLRQMEEAKKREEHMRMVQSANQLQAENRARRDEMLRKLRSENARAQVEMGELEVEAKEREIEEVRLKQQALLNAKKEQIRLKNEMAMQQAKEKQHLISARHEAALEQKGLLTSLNTSSAFNNDLLTTTNAAGSSIGGAGQHMGESEMQRHMKIAADQRRFQEKHEREAQRLATATEIAEQNRLKALQTIQRKERKSKEQLAKETEARQNYLAQNYDATIANLERAKIMRQRQEEETRLYREQLEIERSETQAMRDQRVFMENQLKSEDRMARDEWRRSVFERSKRYEELKKLDAEEKVQSKQEAAEQRRREIKAEIDAINAGEALYMS